MNSFCMFTICTSGSVSNLLRLWVFHVKHFTSNHNINSNNHSSISRFFTTNFVLSYLLTLLETWDIHTGFMFFLSSTSFTFILLQATKLCPQTRAPTSRLLHLRELNGNAFNFDRGRHSFQEEFHKLQASKPVVIYKFPNSFADYLKFTNSSC